MTVVQDLIHYPDSAKPRANASVKVTPAAAFFLDDGTEIRDSSSNLTDTTGLVSFDLPPTPDGYYYVWNYPSGPARTFTVPASGGPYWLKDLPAWDGTTPPSGLSAAMLRALLDGVYVALPPGGTTAGDVPVVQGDGSVDWVALSGTVTTTTDPDGTTVVVIG